MKENYSILKGYIIEPFDRPPFFSMEAEKGNNLRVHKFKIKVLNDCLVDHGVFMIDEIPCQINKLGIVVPNVVRTLTTWNYRQSRPIRSFGQVFIRCGRKWIDAVSTTPLLEKIYFENLQVNPISKAEILSSFRLVGLSHAEIDKISSRYTKLIELDEFASWVVFLFQHKYEKEYCREAIRDSSKQKLEEFFSYSCRKYSIAKEAIRYYVSRIERRHK